MPVHWKRKAQQVATGMAMCQGHLGSTGFRRVMRPKHPSAASANDVEDELPGRAVPRAGPATGCCFSRSTENLTSSGAAKKHFTLLEQDQLSAICPPQSCCQEPGQPLSVHYALASLKVRRQAGRCSCPSEAAMPSLRPTPKSVLCVLCLTPEGDRWGPGRVRAAGPGECLHTWD